MRELPTIDIAQILIRAATGEAYGDGEIVTDLATEYCEPGYSTNSGVIVFGNWNPKRFPRNDDPALTKSESIGPRLADALEKIGAEIEWLDEWVRCCECGKAFRSEPNSYSWKMHGAFVECDYVCANCILADLESYLPDYVDNPSTCLTFGRSGDLEAIGFEQWEIGNPKRYQSGWYEGQNDKPEDITKEIRREFPNAEILFLLDHSGQFDIGFSAWIRKSELDEEIADEFENDEEIESDDETDSLCRLHGSPDCNDPACIGVLRSEVRDAELWGGTE